MFRHAFVIPSALPPPEISHRLSALISAPVPLLRVLRGPDTADPFRITESRQLTGSVTHERFSAYPTRLTRGLVPPCVSGTISARPDGSVVTVTVAPPLGDLLLLAVTSALFAGLGVYVLFLAGTLHEFWLVGAGLLAISVLPWPLTSAASRSTARTFRLHATRLLTEQRPEA